MAKRNPNSFLKRQKEIKRQQKAQEKMMRRQGHKKQEPEEEINEAIAPDEWKQTAKTNPPGKRKTKKLVSGRETTFPVSEQGRAPLTPRKQRPANESITRSLEEKGAAC
jgi:hypothetical protein